MILVAACRHRSEHFVQCLRCMLLAVHQLVVWLKDLSLFPKRDQQADLALPVDVSAEDRMMMRVMRAEKQGRKQPRQHSSGGPRTWAGMRVRADLLLVLLVQCRAPPLEASPVNRYRAGISGRARQALFSSQTDGAYERCLG